jgi:hypothetical protein
MVVLNILLTNMAKYSRDVGISQFERLRELSGFPYITRLFKKNFDFKKVILQSSAAHQE